MYRDVEPGPSQPPAPVRSGRPVIAAIGVDRYATWRPLSNAVSDAKAAVRLFQQLGFVELTGPLLDGAATREALHRLVTGELMQLTEDDSLVLFFAGHGQTHVAAAGGASVNTGYVIPVDAAHRGKDAAATWLRLDNWLSDIARLPPRHILVIIDACHSGCALDALHKWREDAPWPSTQLDMLRARRSRRVITSALGDQRAMDNGPYPGHSLFTGCLIEALSGGLAVGGQRVTTGRELGQYIHRRVGTFPGSTQTPDVGAFEFDDRGDIVIPLLDVTAASVTFAPASRGEPKPADVVSSPAVSDPAVSEPVAPTPGPATAAAWTAVSISARPTSMGPGSLATLPGLPSSTARPATAAAWTAAPISASPTSMGPG